MKPFYRVKGKYTDGRNRIVIEKGEQSKALPKPEKLWKILDTQKNDVSTKEKLDTIK